MDAFRFTSLPGYCGVKFRLDFPPVEFKGLTKPVKLLAVD